VERLAEDHDPLDHNMPLVIEPFLDDSVFDRLRGRLDKGLHSFGNSFFINFFVFGAHYFFLLRPQELKDVLTSPVD
jgi:hypothetical protein